MTTPTNASPESEITKRAQLARRAAKQAGQLTLQYFQQDNYQVDRKEDDSPVTIADREAEELLRQIISDAFPDDAILGEELPETPGTSGFRWILDPIDGTKSFITGVPLYGTLVAVEYESVSVIGVILIPALGECVWAARGQGAWFQRNDEPPVPAKVSTTESLQQSTFLTTQIDSFQSDQRRAAFEKLQAAARITRTWGDCYGYLLVATGRAEVMVDPEMNLWDAAALQPILEEAGGSFTDWQGTATIHSGEGIATNGHVAQQVLAITRGQAS